MSVKLTDPQLVMMSAAAQRKDRCLSAPVTIKGAALIKVSAKLAKLGLIREIEAKPGAPIWRRDDAGQSYALKLTAAGLKAIAVDEGSQDANGSALEIESTGSRTPLLTGVIVPYRNATRRTAAGPSRRRRKRSPSLRSQYRHPEAR